jgi:hypothetical protein
MGYVTTQEMEARLPDFDPASAPAVAVVQALIDEASAYLDAETGETFAVPAVGAVASARVVYGSGTGYLAVDEHTGTIAAEDITIASGAAVPSFVDRGRYLVTTDTAGDLEPSHGTVWPAGQKITVTAVWGVGAIPADLKTACRELVVAWYVRSYAERPESAPSEIPPSVTRTITRYAVRRGLRRAFA